RDCGVDAVVAPRMGESLPRGGRQVSTIMSFCPVYAGLRGSVAVSWSVCRGFPRSTLHQAESLPDHEACRCGPAGHRTPPPHAGPLSQVTDGSRPYRARNPATRPANSIYSGMNTFLMNMRIHQAASLPCPPAGPTASPADHMS